MTRAFAVKNLICERKDLTSLHLFVRIFFLLKLTGFLNQAGKMEAILQKLIMPDNAAIQEGTAELKEAFKQPNAIPMLCAVLTSSANPQIRQYSALLLRKKLGKQKTWRSISAEDRLSLKVGTIDTLTKEPEKQVQHAIIQLIGRLIYKCSNFVLLV